MKRITMTAAVLLVCAAWALAQGYPSSQTSSASTSGQTTVQGCLSGTGGNYSLTDQSGTTYQLAGDTSKLTEHVGHEVEITGATSGASSSATASSTGASASTQPTLTVSSVKHISATCSSASKSGQSAPQSNQEPMSEKPPKK